MITTFKELAKHWPTSWPADKVDLPTPLLLRAKPKWRRTNDVGLMTSFFGCNELQFIVDKLTIIFLGLKENVLSNKTS
jgi:hypothetical protein